MLSLNNNHSVIKTDVRTQLNFSKKYYILIIVKTNVIIISPINDVLRYLGKRGKIKLLYQIE